MTPIKISWKFDLKSKSYENLSRQARINKIATLCGWGGLLKGGSGFPHVLLHLKKNNHHIQKKLKKFVSFIEKLDDPKYRPYYKFFGVKTSYVLVIFNMWTNLCHHYIFKFFEYRVCHMCYQ